MLGGADEHGHDVALAHTGRQMAVYLIGRGNFVLKQFLEQRIIEVRQRFQHLLARGGVLVGHIGRYVDLLGRLTGGVFVGAAR